MVCCWLIVVVLVDYVCCGVLVGGVLLWNSDFSCVCSLVLLVCWWIEIVCCMVVFSSLLLELVEIVIE